MADEAAARTLERTHAVRRGHRGVTTKLVREVEELLCREEPLESPQRNRLNVIRQQLDGKSKLLSDMDKDILSQCELDAVDAEIEESEAVVAKIIDCKQQIEEATRVPTTSGISYALTPAHLIYGRRLAISPSAGHFEVVSTNKSLTKRAKNQRHLLAQLINCWRKDYLLSLREHRSVKAKSQGLSVRIGDVVIVKDDNVKRIFWKMARVVELLKGSDGVTRAALINVSNGNGPPKILKRSVRHLIPIEVTDADDGVNGIDKPSTDSPEMDDRNVIATDSSVNVDPTRSRRQAAVLGEATRRTWTG